MAVDNRDARILEDAGISVKMKLSALWAALMFLYLYADVLSLYKPGQLDKAMNGQMGPFQVSQAVLLIASMLVIVPAFMVVLALSLTPRVNRWANIALGLAFTLVNINNLIGETWLYYLLFGILEILLTLLIVVSAWRWPQSAYTAEAKAANRIGSGGMHSSERVPAIEGRRS
jgi:hypothetical protein